MIRLTVFKIEPEVVIRVFTFELSLDFTTNQQIYCQKFHHSNAVCLESLLDKNWAYKNWDCSYSVKIGLRNCPVIQDGKKWIPLGLILRPQSCLTTKLFPFWVLSLFSTFALSSRISTYGFLDIVALLCLSVINEKNDRQATLAFEWPWYLLWFSVCVHTLLIDFKILFSDWSKEFCT